jgi:dolichol-phosphate mannosyltransferase
MRALVYHALPPDVGDFRLISRPCLDALNQMRETHRFLRGMMAWVGFPQVAVPYHRNGRVAGNTKYSLRKMLTFAWVAATSFSTLPLRLSMMFGAMVGVLGIEEGVRAAMAHFFGWYTVPGWTSLTVLVSLVGSALLISIGILGEYVAKLYEQSKGRPLYVVAQTFGGSSTVSDKAREWDAAVHAE